MVITRRDFMKSSAVTIGAVLGPWSLEGRKGHAATKDTPMLEFLTPSEYRLINRMAEEIIPDEPVLTGKVDVAKNIDSFFAHENYSPDFLIMFRFLRLIRLADPVLPLIKKAVPLTYEDIMNFKRTLVFLGYYSDLNREADMPPEKRIVWPRLGYDGPKPEDWFPPDKEIQLDPSILKDRIKEG